MNQERKSESANNEEEKPKRKRTDKAKEKDEEKLKRQARPKAKKETEWEPGVFGGPKIKTKQTTIVFGQKPLKE